MSESRRDADAVAGVTVKALSAAVGLSLPAVCQVLNGTGRLSARTRARVVNLAEATGLARTRWPA